jgi:hypothetical protein
MLLPDRKLTEISSHQEAQAGVPKCTTCANPQDVPKGTEIEMSDFCLFVLSSTAWLAVWSLFPCHQMKQLIRGGQRKTLLGTSQIVHDIITAN